MKRRPPDVIDEMTASIYYWYAQRYRGKTPKWRWMLEQVAHSVWEVTEVDIGRPVISRDTANIYGILHTTSVTSKYKWSVRRSKTDPESVVVTYLGRFPSLLEG